MNDALSAFGEAAAHRLPPIMVSGRLPVFSTIIDETVEDVSAKLRPEKTDRLLEIGCGLGLLLRPLASMVHEAVGIIGGPRSPRSNRSQKASDARAVS